MTNAAASSRTMPAVVAAAPDATVAIGSTPDPPAPREGAQQPFPSVTDRVSQARRTGQSPRTDDPSRGAGADNCARRAQVAPHAHPRVGPVHHGARLERHERGDLADRRGPRYDDP